MRFKYTQFIQEGSLVLMPEVTLDMMTVFDDLDRHIILKQYDVRCVGYDPYNASEFMTRWEQENGPYGIEKSNTRLWVKLKPPPRSVYYYLMNMSFTMGNCVVEEDSNRNRKLYKKRYEQKIDAVSAMLDAWVSLKLNKEMFF